MGKIEKVFDEVTTKWTGFGDKVYRGESKQYDQICLPSIWRPNSKYNSEELKVSNSDSSILTKSDVESINDFKEGYGKEFPKDYLFEELKDKLEDDSIYWFCLAQHYGARKGVYTRLLDVTQNILSAIYFACDSNPEDNGYIYFIARSSCRSLSRPAPGSYPKTISEFFEVDGNDENLLKVPFLFEPLVANERINRQSGAFIWTKEIGNSCWRGGGIIEIDKNDKPEILEELGELGITKEFIYPNE